MQIQENGLINKLWIKYAKGILKSNEIPNAYFIVNNDILLIILHSTIMYSVSLPENTGMYKSFTAYIDDNKEIIPVELCEDYNININKTKDYYFGLYYNFNQYQIMQSDLNVTENPDYKALMDLKAADGMRLYKIHKVMNLGIIHTWYIPVFSGFPSLNKSDTADIHIRKYNMKDKYYIVNYKIHKAKIKTDVDMWFTAVELG